MGAPLTPSLLIDARMVEPTPHGIARYVTALYKGLAHLNQRTRLPYRPIFLTDSRFPNALQTHAGQNEFEVLPCSTPFLSFREGIEIPRLLKKQGARGYHSPSFSSPWTCPCPSIVTIHDLNHLQFGSVPQKAYYQILLRRFAFKSTSVVTVSQFSQGEIAQWLNLPRERIQVVYNAIESRPSHPAANPPSQELLDRFGLTQGEYFFCLCNSKPHKNTEFLIQAYLAYRAQHAKPWPLVMTLKPRAKGHLSPHGVVWAGNLPDGGAQTLLALSAGLFSPSLYEGFGLPPVEAATTGVPVVASSIPPHREGLADLLPYEALWVSPTDRHGWTQAFHRIHRQELSRPSLESQNKIRERFSAEKLAGDMDLLYRRMLNIKR